ncbi:hypothetical protein ACFLQ2_03980 [archaeon]
MATKGEHIDKAVSIAAGSVGEEHAWDISGALEKVIPKLVSKKGTFEVHQVRNQILEKVSDELREKLSKKRTREKFEAKFDKALEYLLEQKLLVRSKTQIISMTAEEPLQYLWGGEGAGKTMAKEVSQNRQQSAASIAMRVAQKFPERRDEAYNFARSIIGKGIPRQEETLKQFGIDPNVLHDEINAAGRAFKGKDLVQKSEIKGKPVIKRIEEPKRL